MDTLKITVQLTKALAHPTRLRILALLHQGPLPVCQITSVLHSVESTVSGHLLERRRSGLVAEQRQGKFVYYCLGDAASSVRVLDALLPTLTEDAQLRQDPALGESIRDISELIVCEGSAGRPGNGAGARPTARAGSRRS